MRIAAKAGAIFDKALTAMMIIAVLVVVFDMLAISIDVLMRYSIGVTWPALFELSEYSILWMTFLSAAWISKIDGHVKVDLVLNRLSPRNKAIANTVTSIICTILMVIIVWFTLKLTVADYQTGYYYISVLQPPKWVIEMIIPFGCFLLFIQFFRLAYRNLASRKVLTMGEQTHSYNTTGGER